MTFVVYIDLNHIFVPKSQVLIVYNSKYFPSIPLFFKASAFLFP